MSKKYNILIFILLIANNLLADDDTHKLINDSTKYSKFNIHAGVGLLNGTRLGINYRFNKNISVNIDYGISTPLIFGNLGAPPTVFNIDINYHYKNKSGTMLNISITYGKWENITPVFVISPNLGYVFYNPTKSVYSLQCRLGAGILFSLEGPFDKREAYFLPNLDIILGIQL